MKSHEDAKKKLFEFWDKDETYYDILGVEILKEDVQQERKEVAVFVKNGLILDVACGAGDAGKFMPKNTKYIGIEISMAGLRAGKNRNRHVTFVRGDVELLPFANNAFQNVVCLYSFEHFLKPKEILDEMVRVLAPGGILIIRSPSHDNIFNIPESLKMQTNTKSKKLAYVIRRLLKYIQPGFHPTLITEPDVLKYGYVSDRDLTNIVTIREIKKYFEKKGLKIIYLKQHNAWYNKWMLKHWNTPLFIIGEKK